MQFRILGPLEARDAASDVLPLGSPRQQAVLAVLLIDAGRVVSVSKIVDAVWDEDPPDTVVRTVRSYVSRLRSRLGEDLITTRTPGYVIEAARESIDAFRFEDAVIEARSLRERGSHLLAAERLADALDLWSGPALAGLEDYEFARVEATKLAELRLEALEARIDSDLTLGRHERLISELEQLVVEDPLREGPWRFLMLALYRSGRQAEALRAYQRAREVLGSQLGLEPSPELRELEDAILMQSEELATPVAPQRKLSNLPEPLTSFIGRIEILSEIAAALGQSRCLTLIGVGGSGKTRLGIEAARHALGSFTDGVRLVEFAAIDDGELVPEHIAAAIGEPGSHAEDVTAVLAEYLTDKQMLIVMDNCEHLAARIAEAVDVLLSRCPDLRVLATSREPLRTQGEAVFHVPPLEVPRADQTAQEQEDTESARLLSERAADARRRFAVDDGTRQDVVAICRALDGIPLALELAAARIGAMSVAEVAHRLDHRFDLLTQGARTAPPRQQTLRATIDWSHDLLSEPERLLFRRLAVFSGGWTIDAAIAVCDGDGLSEGDVFTALTGLVDRCLVELADQASASRYRMLETIKEYAFEQLVLSGEAPIVSRRHRDWCIAVVEAAGPGLRGPDQVETWTRLEHDHDNMRSAIRWSLETGEVTEAFRLTGTMAWFWFMRGFWRESWRWFERCEAHRGTPDPATRATAIHEVGAIEVIRMNAQAARNLLEEALATCRAGGDRNGEAWCLHLQGHSMEDDEDAARSLMQEALEIFEELGDEWAIAWSERYLGWNGVDWDTGLALQWRSLERYEALGDQWSVAYGKYALGNYFEMLGRWEEAIEVLEESIEIAGSVGDIIWTAHSASRLGVAEYNTQDFEPARGYLQEALDVLQLIGDDNCVGLSSAYLSLIATRQRRWPEAAKWMGRALVLYRKLGGEFSQYALLTRLATVFAEDGDLDLGAVVIGATEELSRRFSTLAPSLDVERTAVDNRLSSELAPFELGALLDRGRSLGLVGAGDVLLATLQSR